jgi:hypothetical protein
MAVSYKYQKFNAQTREFCESQMSNSEEGKSRSPLKSLDKMEKATVIVKTIDAGYKNKIKFGEGFGRGSMRKEPGEKAYRCPLSCSSLMRDTGSA